MWRMMMLTKSLDLKTYRTTLCASLNCSKCCTCHAKMLRLPCKTTQKSSKCCTCHAKRARGTPSAAPATQKQPDEPQMLQTEAAPNVINCCPDPHEGAPSAVPATQNKPEVLKLPSYMDLEDVKTTLSRRFRVTDDYPRHPYFVRPARHFRHF